MIRVTANEMAIQTIRQIEGNKMHKIDDRIYSATQNGEFSIEFNFSDPIFKFLKRKQNILNYLHLKGYRLFVNTLSEDDSWETFTVRWDHNFIF